MNELDKVVIGEWSEAFVYELALGILPTQQICEAHGVSVEKYAELRENDLFIRALAKYQKEIKLNGTSLQLKAAITQEELLPVLYSIAKDSNVPAASRISAIETISEWAGSKEKKDEVPTLSFNFAFKGDVEPEVKVVEGNKDAKDV